MLERSNKKQGVLDKKDFEAKQNLLWFFDLLLKIDMRNKPQLYKKQSNENNRNTNNTD